MRYGICTGIENAGLVKKLGYDYIELSVTKTMGLDPAAYAVGKKALEESGIEAECFNILFPKTMNFVDGKTTNLDALEAYLEKAMAMIADLHGKVSCSVVASSVHARRRSSIWTLTRPLSKPAD